MKAKMTDQAISVFKYRKETGGAKTVLLSYHAQEEMADENITAKMLINCMAEKPELIEFRWEYPDTQAKGIFLCEPDEFPPFHVVCKVDNDKAFVITAYLVSSDKYKGDNKTRQPRTK
ncbi:DUF4258 domain-containing protein [Paenibacillus sp. GCM10027629]|uniref:DUF4258 domain-containing protein n=1 Tax=Paenibacillus sp. GCM10027629 TaxID=3273414 RepID=UPI0036D4171C